jgi:hypothetical protein
MIAALVGVIALLGGAAAVFLALRRVESPNAPTARTMTAAPNVLHAGAAGAAPTSVANEPPRAGATSTAANANPPVAPPASPATITLSSDPPGATVSADGHVLGVAPIDVPRPEPNHSRQYVVTAPGRTQVSVTLAFDTPRAVAVTLPPQPHPGGAARPGPHRPQRRGELLDPWAN